MTTIDETLDDARDAATDFFNAEGRGPGHILLGVAVTAGFALLATAFATGTLRPLRRDSGSDDQDGPVTERPRGPISLVLPAMFSVTTLSALRVWNAPSRPGRKSALGLWAAAQAVNAVWIALRPAGRGLQIAAAMSSAGLAAAFAHEARKLDVGAGKLASPIGGRVRLANRLQGRSRDGNPAAG
ncbi:TspO protein [uncultured Brevundimonas sp.]|uniref:TspO protein n=1 Tax=uncultured Brevundimonas sp. TaxID=213418 RepID=UPI0030ECD734|tara:strand:- start:108 stop:662 length:555 start_codon:yes stop_codon:yes gene_type:complete